MKNIVFIMADQLGAGVLNCYGGGVDSTPGLDDLAAEGVRFDRCYATHPVCAPSRATALSGRSLQVHGVVSNNYALQADNPTYAHLLKRRGYRTGGFGKFHQTPMSLPVPDDLAYLGFDESVVSEDPKWGPWIDWIRCAHPDHYETTLAMCWGPQVDPTRAAEHERWRTARDRIVRPLREASAFGHMYASPLPATLHDTTYITDLGLGFMRRHVAAHGDRPFFCHISYVDPHDPYDPPRPYDTAFRPEDMPSPRPARWLEKGCRELDESRGRFSGFQEISEDPEVIRTLRAFYHGSLMFLDDQIKRVVDFLKQNDLWEDTVLIFTSDHGEMLGDHALITKGIKHYDWGIRCPLIVAGGGVESGVADRLTCTLDLFPTLCDWADVPIEDRPPVEGRSFARVCSGGVEPDPWHEISVAIAQTQSVITDDGWRLTFYARTGEGQMFHLSEDPDEQMDLYDHPDQVKKQLELQQRLIAVSMRPSHVPHYRNMPIHESRKLYFGRDRKPTQLPFRMSYGPPAYPLSEG